MKNSTTPARQLDFQGLAGFVSVSVLFFSGSVSGWVWEWIFNDFWMDLGAVLAPKIDKRRHRFRVGFWDGKKHDYGV